MKNQCSHVNRLPIAVRGQVLGAPSVGRCESDCFPGLVVCFEHADKEVLAYMVETLLRDFEKATGSKHHFQLPAKKPSRQSKVS